MMENNLVVLTPATIGHYRHGLISPKGEFYGCASMGHIDLSYDLQDANLLAGDFEDYGWLKYSICKMLDGAPMEFSFMFSTTKRVNRPAKPKEKSFMIMDGVRMISDNVDVYHILQPAQIDFILELKKLQGKNTVNFNWQEYTIADFILHVADMNEYSRSNTQTHADENIR